MFCFSYPICIFYFFLVVASFLFFAFCAFGEFVFRLTQTQKEPKKQKKKKTKNEKRKKVLFFWGGVFP